MRGRILLVFLLVAVAGCGDEDRDSRAAAPAATDKREGPRKIETVREAAVAGERLFYPAEGEALSKLLDGFLARAGGKPPKDLRALICPHAGYRFSGQTAAIGYKQAAGGKFRTVIVLAPSHYAAFVGASVPAVDAYRTPLGLIPLSHKADRLAGVRPFVRNPHCRVSRPGWSRQSPKRAPPLGQDTPHTWEHSLEVQLPFLQKVLKDFTLVPVVFGRLDAKAAAKALEPFVDAGTLIVASSDLSHFRPYDEAQLVDKATIAAICRLDADVLGGANACGYAPIRTLLHLAKANGWKGRLLDYRNSGDTAGDKSRVVGYAAVGFYGPAPPERKLPPLPPPTTRPAPRRLATRAAGVYPGPERRFMLDLARKTLGEVVLTGSAAAVDARGVPKSLIPHKACFVTLTKGGRLRGCIGSILPQEPLYQAVVNMTRNAATRDTRFTPVSKGELDAIEIEISILTVPRPLTFSSPAELLAKLRPGIDGVILRAGRRQSTYLPQVWEKIPDKAAFLSNLSRKAGLASSAWRQGGVSIMTYQAEAFHERDGRDH